MPECQVGLSDRKPIIDTFVTFISKKEWHGLLRNEWHGLLRNHWHGLHRNHWHGLLRNEWHGIVRNSQYEIFNLHIIISSITKPIMSEH